MSSTTDPGNRSPREIERELEHDRQRLRETGRALQSRLSVGTLIDEMLTRTRDRGPDYAVGLGRTIRENPIPVALIGVSLAWLMAGGQRASEERFRHDRGYGHHGGPDDEDLHPRPAPVGAPKPPARTETPLAGAGTAAPTATGSLREPPPAVGPTDPLRPTPRPAGDAGAKPSPASGGAAPLGGSGIGADKPGAAPRPVSSTGDARPADPAPGTGHDPLRPGGGSAASPANPLKDEKDEPRGLGGTSQSSGFRSSTPPPASRPLGADEPKRPGQNDDKDKS